MVEHWQQSKLSFTGEEFSAEEREMQRLEDQQAWRAITGILIFILCIGLFLGISTVLIVANVGSG